ncbi:FAD-dependent oxidoreductase [Nocardioides sp.]|uniref:NAD(P)/FAD-dependent oxidoreductase n=1 Tax=Nocardioides sp. TaxID=35761 RepID=UPI00321BB3CD
MPAGADDALVVVGASLAGLRAVEAARRKGFTGPITLVGAEGHLPYDRPPLSKAYLDEKEQATSEPFRTEEHLRTELGVELLLGRPATRLRHADRVLEVGDTEVRFGALIIATGGTAISLPGTEGLEGIHCLRTLDDAVAVREALDTRARVVVVGAGFIGSEVASAARKRGLPVTVVEALDVPLVRSVGPEAGRVCAELHAANGTDLRCGSGVQRVEGTAGRVSSVHLGDGTVLEADLVVVGIGVRPATEWLQDSGIELHGRDGGIVCDDLLRTSLDDVFAAGDVVHWPNPVFDGRLMRLEHWTNAAEHGAAAATAAVAPDTAKAVGTVPYFWSDWYDHRIQFVGIPSEPDEVRVVAQEPYLALYRQGDRVVGALTIDRPTQIMKYRRMISQRKLWSEALEFAGAAS